MRQRGNILFLILLAVVLFAALAYAVTSSMRGGGKDGSSETTDTQVAEIFQFLNQIDSALMRMQLTNSLKPESINFAYPQPKYDNSINQINSLANCSTTSCQLFHVDGGGVAVKDMSRFGVPAPTGWNTAWEKPGYYTFIMMQWPGAGTNANDLIVRLAGIKPAICAKINAQMAITSTPGYVGTYVAANVPANWDNSAYTISSNVHQLYGKDTFASAISGTGDGQYCHIFHLLIER